MKEQIYGFITKKDGGVSFAEIMDTFGQGNAELSKGNNIILWYRLTSKTADAIIDLLAEKRILMYPTHPVIYIADGCALNLPFVKRPPKNGYKEPHWLPVVLWTTEQFKANMKAGLVSPGKAVIYRDDGYDI